MNNNRRKEITNIIKDMEFMHQKIEEIKDDEQDYFDSMPENLQFSENGMKSENAIEQLEDVLFDIDNAINELKEAIV